MIKEARFVGRGADGRAEACPFKEPRPKCLLVELFIVGLKPHASAGLTLPAFDDWKFGRVRSEDRPGLPLR